MAENKMYWASALIGGAVGAVDKIDGASLLDGDSLIAVLSTGVLIYQVDVDSAAAEDSPFVISPDTNAGDKRWILVGQVVTLGAGAPTPVEGLTESNIAVGNAALAANTTGSENTAVGVHALKLNTTGTENNAFGALALAANTIGQENVGVGVRALTANTTGSQNTAVGHAALMDNTVGTENTAIGQTALYENISGIQNTAVGRQALEKNTTGGLNTAVGHTALNQNTGDYNTAIGRQAGYNTTSGSQNIMVGVDSLLNNTTGSGNVAVGYSTGLGITTGSNNTIIGANVTGLAAALTGNIILADGTGAIKAQWDGSIWSLSGMARLNTTSDRTGQFGIDHNGVGRFGLAIHNTDSGSSGQYVMYFTRGAAVANVGSIAATDTTTTYNTSSDYRLKTGVKPIVNALAAIEKLKPCDFRWKSNGLSGQGFIAHELQEIIPQAVTGEKDSKYMQGVDFSKVVPILTAAVQELSAENKKLWKRLEMLN